MSGSRTMNDMTYDELKQVQKNLKKSIKDGDKSDMTEAAYQRVTGLLAERSRFSKLYTKTIKEGKEGEKRLKELLAPTKNLGANERDLERNRAESIQKEVKVKKEKMKEVMKKIDSEAAVIKMRLHNKKTGGA